MAFTLVMGASMQFLWALINTLQLIINVPLFTITMPFNAKLFFSTLVSIATFDLLPSEKFNEILFSFSESDPINENFEDMGFETRSTISNIGSQFYFIALYFILIISFFLIKVLKLCTQNEAVVKIHAKMREKLLFGPIIRLITEGYMDVSICALIQIQSLSIEGPSDMVDFTFAILMVGISILCPLFCGIFLSRNRPKLEDAEFRTKFDSLYEGYEVMRTHSVGFIAFFFLRRLVFGLSAVYLGEYPAAQILLYTLLSMLNCMFIIHAKPYETPWSNKFIYIFALIYLGNDKAYKKVFKLHDELGKSKEITRSQYEH